MNYVGIDIHKRYSVLCAQDESGQKLREARIEGHEAKAYARFFRELEGASKAVLEACWNWRLSDRGLKLTCFNVNVAVPSSIRRGQSQPLDYARVAQAIRRVEAS